MNAPRVSIGVGTRARFHLDVFVARPVCLAGMVLKFEAAREVTGEVTDVAACEGPLLPGEKREHVFTVRTADVDVELRRSWCRFAEVMSE